MKIDLGYATFSFLFFCVLTPLLVCALYFNYQMLIMAHSPYWVAFSIVTSLFLGYLLFGSLQRGVDSYRRAVGKK